MRVAHIAVVAAVRRCLNVQQKIENARRLGLLTGGVSILRGVGYMLLENNNAGVGGVV